MSGPANDFSRLMQRAAEGDPNAFTELVQLYNPNLLAQLRSCFKKIPWLHSLLDPEDLAQNIWIDFVNGPLHQCQFPTPDHLLYYLARAAHNHIRNAVRHLSRQKRDARRCQSLGEADAGAAAAVVADHSPTPAWTAEVKDGYERGLSALTDEQLQAAHMMGDGFSQAEIAAELGCSLRTIERMVEEIRHALAVLLPGAV